MSKRLFSALALASSATLALSACDQAPTGENALDTQLRTVHCYDINGQEVFNVEAQRNDDQISIDQSHGVLKIKEGSETVGFASGSSCVQANYNVEPHTIDDEIWHEDTMQIIASNGFNRIIGSINGELTSTGTTSDPRIEVKLYNANREVLATYRLYAMNLVGSQTPAQDFGAPLQQAMRSDIPSLGMPN